MPGAGARLFDARHRDAQIEVVGERLPDERLQRRIVEHLKPRRVGQRLRLGRRSRRTGTAAELGIWGRS